MEDIAVYLQTEIAQKCGMTRKALYKVLRSDNSFRFEAIGKIMKAPNIKLAATAPNSMNTKKSKNRDWQSFLALEPLDEDLPRILDNGKTHDPFQNWEELSHPKTSE